MSESNLTPVGTPAAFWLAEGQPDPHGDHYNCERSKLCKGSMTDDQLANDQFMAATMIAHQTAIKERIRWLSRRMTEAHRLIGNIFGKLKTTKVTEDDRMLGYRKLDEGRYVVYNQKAFVGICESFYPHIAKGVLQVNLDKFPVILQLFKQPDPEDMSALPFTFFDLEDAMELIDLHGVQTTTAAPINPDEDQFYDKYVRQIVNWMGYSHPTPAKLREVLGRCVSGELPAWLEAELAGRGEDHVVDNASRAVILYKAMLDPIGRIESVEDVKKHK